MKHCMACEVDWNDDTETCWNCGTLRNILTTWPRPSVYGRWHPDGQAPPGLDDAA